MDEKMKNKKIFLICSLVLIGTIKSASTMGMLDKGKNLRPSLSRMLCRNFSLNIEDFLNVKMLPTKKDVSKFISGYGRIIASHFVEKKTDYRRMQMPVRHFLVQELYPLRPITEIYTEEDLKVVIRNTDAYIQRMFQYPKDSRIYKKDKERLQGHYLTPDSFISERREKLISRYQDYVLSLIKTYGFNLTTQADVVELLKISLDPLAFFNNESEKNFFRYCGINTHAWYNVQMHYPFYSLSLAYALCDPKMPQKYRIPESKFKEILDNCCSRIDKQANYLMSKAYNTFILTEEQMIQEAQREKLMRDEDNIYQAEGQEYQEDYILHELLPFYSKEFAKQIGQIEYERNRRLGYLKSLSERYYT